MNLELQRHKEMLLAFEGQPDKERIGNRPQHPPERRLFRGEQCRWKLLGQYIDYLQQQQYGHTPQHPKERWSMTETQTEITIAHGNVLWARLQCLIGDPIAPETTGFALCRKMAIAKGWAFPWEHPRTLFAETCQSEAAEAWDTQYSSPTLTKVNKALKQHLRFLKGNIKNTQQEQEWLTAYAAEPGWDFRWVAATYPARYKKTLRPYWQKYIKAEKAYLDVINNPPNKRNEIISVRRIENGMLINPQNRQIITISEPTTTPKLRTG